MRICAYGQRGEVFRRKHHRKERRWKWMTWNIAVAICNAEANIGGRHAMRVTACRWKLRSWSIACLDQKMRTCALSRSQKVREMKMVVESSYCSTLKEEVDALRWLMQCVMSMEQITYGLHEKKRSSLGRKRPTPGIQSES